MLREIVRRRSAAGIAQPCIYRIRHRPQPIATDLRLMNALAMVVHPLHLAFATGQRAGRLKRDVRRSLRFFLESLPGGSFDPARSHVSETPGFRSTFTDRASSRPLVVKFQYEVWREVRRCRGRSLRSVLGID